MKTKIYLFSILTLLLNSCSFFQSKEELLTKEKWVLHSRFISDFKDGKAENDMIFYKKADEALVLKFEKDGTIRITEENGLKVATIRWEWKSEDKKYITLDKGSHTGDFHILELTGSTFKWSKSDIYSTKSTLEIFKHLGDKEWDDENVDMKNTMK